MSRSTVDVDVHRVGEPVAWVMAERDLEQMSVAIPIAAQDPQHRGAARNAERAGDVQPGTHRLDVLRDTSDADTGELLDLAEQRASAEVETGDRLCQRSVKEGVGRRDRQRIAFAGSDPSKEKPGATRVSIDLLGDAAWQVARAFRFIHHRAAAGVLQYLADIGEWLVQRTAARRSRLDDRPGPASASDQSLALQSAQCLAHREATNTVALTELAFGRERVASGEFSRENFAAQVTGELKIPWCLPRRRAIGGSAQTQLPEVPMPIGALASLATMVPDGERQREICIVTERMA